MTSMEGVVVTMKKMETSSVQLGMVARKRSQKLLLIIISVRIRYANEILSI